MLIPSLLLKQLYTFGSLKNVEDGVMFSLKNRLSDATLLGVNSLTLGDQEISMDKVRIVLADGTHLKPDQISKSNPIDFPLRATLDIYADTEQLSQGKHKIEISFEAKPFGKLKLKVEGGITAKDDRQILIPRSKKDDYDEEIIKIRQKFVEDYSGKKLEHIGHYSFDPHITNGNCEHFTGVAQVPIGFAGPLNIHGEYAKGEFIIPMAIQKDALVASCNQRHETD
ncbi:MAG: hypothetical protein R3B93_05515 [Bacteroidia bacterium]